MRPPRALPAAHFDRNERHVISGTGHKLANWSAAIPVDAVAAVTTTYRQLLSPSAEYLPPLGLGRGWTKSALSG
jgi:hypothetical protein